MVLREDSLAPTVAQALVSVVISLLHPEIDQELAQDKINKFR